MTPIQASAILTHGRGTVIAPCREVEHEGRAYLVAPLVALVPGVLNAELVLADEIGRHVEAWNDAPIPIGHPMRNGVPVSARSLDVLKSKVIGRFQNVRFDGRLVGEAWLDVAKALALGASALLNRLRRGDPVEVSTGYFRDVEVATGVWNGVAYDTISRNIRPDHLALLPDGVGACSWSDGCGIPRVLAALEFLPNHGGDMAVNQDVAVKELSLDAAGELVRGAFLSRFGSLPSLPPAEGNDTWVREIFADRVIASLRGQLVAVPYTFSEDELEVTFSEPVPVEIIYQPVETAPAAQTAPVPHQVGGRSCMDARPQRFAVPLPTPPTLPQELQDFAALLSEIGGVAAMRSTFTAFQANAAAERSILLGELMGNQRCAFTVNELNAMPTQTLTKLARSLRPTDFSGRGMPDKPAEEWEDYNG